MNRKFTLFLLLILVVIGTFPAEAQSDGKRPPITAKNVAQVTQVARWTMGGTRVGSVAFSPDGSLLASGNADKTVTLWDLKSGEPKATLTGPTQPVDSLVFSPDGTLLASDSENPPPGTDPLLWLWDVKSGQAKANLQSQPSRLVGADIIAFSPDGTLLASADGSVHLWDVKSGKLITTLQSSDQNMSYGAVAFSPDGSLLAAASTHDVMATGVIQLWDVRSRRLKATLQHGTDPVDANTLAFSPDGSLLASGSDDDEFGVSVRLWNVKSGKLIANLPNDTSSGVASAVSSVIFSPDGSLLVAGEWEGTVRLWDVKTEKIVVTLQGYTGRVNSVAFSPDGTLIASSGDDGGVRLWGIPTAQQLGTATVTP